MAQIDPSIPLGVRSVQVHDPLEQFSKVQGIRNMIQQGQERNVQMQVQQEALQEHKRATDADQTLGSLLAKHTTTAEDGTTSTNYPEVIKGLGAAGHGNKAREVETAWRADQKQQIDNHKARLDNLNTKIGMIANAAGSLAKVPDEQLPAEFDRVRGELIQGGAASEQQLPASQQIMATGGLPQLKSFIAQHQQQAVKADEQIKNAQADASFGQKVAEFNANQVEKKPKTLKEQTDLAAQLLSAAGSQTQWDGGLNALKEQGVPVSVLDQFGAKFSPEAQQRAADIGMTPNERAQRKAEQQRADEAAKPKPGVDVPFSPAVAAQKTALALAGRPINTYAPSAQPLGADGKPRAATIEDAPPGLRSQIQSALDYGTKLPPSSRNNPTNQAIRDWVTKIDPNYSEAKYAERNKITQDFSAAGKSGQQITSSDTALAHLGTISEAGKALNSSDVQVLNRLANFVGAQVGRSPQVTYESIVDTVAPEISKAVIGGVGGQEDRKKMAENFSAKLSDAQREGAIGGVAKLLGARYHKQAQAYESDMGKPLSRKLSPESQAVLDRYSGGGSSGSPTVSTRAEYDKLPSGATYVDAGDGQTKRKR